MITTVSDKVKFITSVLGSGRLSRSGQNLDVWCPYCAPKDRSKKKLSIRLIDDLWHCWTCDHKGRSLVSLIKKSGSSEQLKDYVDRFLPEDKKVWVGQDDSPQPVKVSLPRDFCLLTLANDHDPDVKAAMRYVTSRGLNQSDLWYYKIGISDDPRWRRRIIVPSFDANGELNYYVGRAIDTQKKPKYDNPDTDKSSIIFNEVNIDWKKRLVLCEGTFDMFKCGDNVVPLLGSSLNEQSKLFNQIIVHSTPVALALDEDMREKRVPFLAHKLMEYDVDVIIVDIRPFADPGQMTKEEFREKLEAAKPLDWRENFSSKLAKATKTWLSL